METRPREIVGIFFWLCNIIRLGQSGFLNFFYKFYKVIKLYCGVSMRN